MVTPPPPFIKFGTRADGKLVGDNSNAHLMTIAPTGAGKGATSIIPNLLTWPGSVFVIDPKGDNIKDTIKRRCELNEKVYLLDPFYIVDTDGKQFKNQNFQRARFNPLDFIGKDDEEDAGITQADRLADTLIVNEGKENAHFANEARAILKALILHVCTDTECMYKDLATINRMASYPDGLVGNGKTPGTLQNNQAYNNLIRRLATRMAAKGDREGPAVWSTLQANLGQFLDDPRLALNLSSSSFDFYSLKSESISVFAVLPAPYLETFNRWLRLLVGSALDRLLLNPDTRENQTPVLMILDEFAHLGYMEAVKTAYGLARSAGLKIWVILQSLSQLDDIYGEHGRENLIANTGTLEIFGMMDNVGCSYFSQKAGQQYFEEHSLSNSVTVQTTKPLHGQRDTGGEVTSVNNTTNTQKALKPLLLPEEIASLDPGQKILFRRKTHQDIPVFEVLNKVFWYNNPHLRDLAGLPRLPS